MTRPAARLAEAADFAARAHIGQKRKGAAGEPYMNHLTEVAALLARSGAGDDTDLLIAALLHDTLEDTATSYDDIASSFGDGVASLVAEVTDDKSLPKDERKRLQVEKTASKTERARLLKLADKISNIRAIAMSPPMGWDRARLAAYVDWAEAVVASCRGLDAGLERLFDAAVTEARAAIETQA